LVAIDKEFDYVVPEAFEATVRVGTVVRVVLAGRRSGAGSPLSMWSRPGGGAVAAGR